MRFYREKKGIWKKEWKRYRHTQKLAKLDYIPFVEWENQRLVELNRSSPDEFKNYCDGYKRMQKLKLTAAGIIGLGALAIGLGTLGTMGLYYGLGSVEFSSASIMILGALAATGVVGLAATIKPRAFKFLSRVWHGKKFKCYKLSFRLFKGKDKQNTKRFEVKKLTRDELQAEPMYARRLKRARLPKIMQAYFKNGDVKVEEEKIESAPAPVVEEVKPTKEEIKKEWYNKNLLNAEKLNVTVYGSEKTQRDDYYTKLGEFESSNLDNVFDKDKIGVQLGKAGATAVADMKDELLLGVREADDLVRKDSSFVRINKKDYPIKTEVIENEDLPEATL